MRLTLDYALDSAFYVDATDMAQEGTWVSSFTGAEVLYLNWFSSEPNGGTNENCLGFYNNGPTLVDIACDMQSESIYGLCEYERKTT